MLHQFAASFPPTPIHPYLRTYVHSTRSSVWHRQLLKRQQRVHQDHAWSLEAILTGLHIKLVREDTSQEHLRDEQRLVELGFVDAQTRGGTATGRPLPSSSSTALAGAQGPKAQDMAGFVTEVMPSFTHWDPQGYVWGRPGHWPLWVMLGPGRYRSDDGWAERAVRGQKLWEWKVTGRWPWWRYHESEKFFWLPGSASSGRGFTGCEAEIVASFRHFPGVHVNAQENPGIPVAISEV